MSCWVNRELTRSDCRLDCFGNRRHCSQQDGSNEAARVREHLQRLSGADAGRPFVCDGDPYKCKAFLVGYNPASQVPFWPFWSDATGFDKSVWFDCYRLYRMAEPLKEGRTRRQPISSTRQRIEWIIDAAKPVQVLETNLYRPCGRGSRFRGAELHASRDRTARSASAWQEGGRGFPSPV
jgi:hypothetical protein